MRLRKLDHHPIIDLFRPRAGTIRVDKELAAAKRQHAEWGFLNGTYSRPLSKTTKPAKYHNHGTWTVKRITVPEHKGGVLPEVSDGVLSAWPPAAQTVTPLHAALQLQCSTPLWRWLFRSLTFIPL